MFISASAARGSKFCQIFQNLATPPMTQPVPIAPDPQQDPSQATSASFSNVSFSALPLIAAEIFSSIHWALCTVILSREIGSSSEYLLSPIFHAGLLAGLLTIVVGHLFDHSSWARRKIFMMVAMILQLAGFSLLSFLDGKLAIDGMVIYVGSRKPWLFTAPGCFCSQFAVAILQLCGRSYILEHFVVLDQRRAQAWAASLTLGVNFAFKITFGLAIRSTDPKYEIDLSKVRIIAFAFGFVGLMVVALAVILIREPPRSVGAREAEWAKLGRLDTFPSFVRIAVPLIIGMAPYIDLMLMIPLQAVALFTQNPGEKMTFSDVFGYAFVSEGCAALLGIGTAWIRHSRGTMIWSLLLSVVVANMYDYQRTPPSVDTCLIVTSFTGMGLGALSSAPWAAFGECAAQRAGANGFVGLLIGLLTMGQGALIQPSALDDSFFMIFSKPRMMVMFVLVAAIAAVNIPSPPAAPDPGYSVISLTTQTT
jgi:hypothetical protein